MKKILFYVHSLNKGGAEHVLLTIADELNKTDEYEAVIVTDTVDELEYVLPEGIKRINLDDMMKSASGFDRILALRSCLKSEKPDEFVVFMLSSAIRAVIAALFTGYKVIAAVRSNPYDDYSAGIKRTELLWCMKRTEAIVCQTKYQAEFFKAGLRNKCVIISNPIFKEFADKAAKLTACATGDDRTESECTKSIMASGRLFDYKNHRLLIKAYAKICKDYPDTNVIIYGEGPYRSELEREIDSLGLKERVLLPGDSSEVEEVISKAYIYVLPSDTEGLPNALMEAMVLGRPAIATDCPCGGPKSLIKDGVNGLLTPVGDVDAMEAALRRLLDDKALCKRLGQNAKEILKTNSLERIVKQWIDLLEKE